MAHQTTHFPKSPIVEAIFSVIAPCRSNLPESDLEAAFRKAVDTDRFPEFHKLHRVDVAMRKHGLTGETETEENTEWAGVIFESRSKEEVLQFRRDGMSYHRLAPYTSYEEVLPEVQKHWATFSMIAKPKATTRQDLRFINRITLPVETPLTKRDRKLRADHPGLCARQRNGADEPAEPGPTSGTGNGPSCLGFVFAG